MKKILSISIAIVIMVISVSGYSLRMDTMGRINIALPDFQSDLDRNPAMVTYLEQPYLELSLGTLNLNRTTGSEYLEPGDIYENESESISKFEMPIELAGFYKLGNLALGVQVEMPTFNSENENKFWRENYNTGHRDDDFSKLSFNKQDTNYSLIIGYRFKNIRFGVDWGQSDFSETGEFYESIKDYNGSLAENTFNAKYEETVEGNMYGTGLGYENGKISLDVSYKTVSYDLNTKYVYVIENGVHQEDDNDTYPPITSVADNNLISFKGSYNLSQGWVISMGIDMFSSNSDTNAKTDTWGEFTVFEIENEYSNYTIGMGKTTENIELGCELGYMPISEKYKRNNVTPTETYLEMDAESDFVLYKVSMGLEYKIMKNLTLRTGGVRYQMGEYSKNSIQYLYTGDILATLVDNFEFDSDNAYVLSLGLEYRVTDKILIEYGYQAGEYLFDDEFEMTGDSEYFLEEIDSNYQDYNSQNALRLHRISAKYEF